MTLNLPRHGLLALSLAALWTYLSVVLLYEERVSGVAVGIVPLSGILLAGYFAAIVLSRRLSPARQQDLALGTLSILLTLLVADLGYSLYSNATRPQSREGALSRERAGDAHVWHGELYPRSYFPTDGKFTVYKPGVQLSGTTFGEFYETAMLRSPTLVESVLELRDVSYVIDSHGFRNRAPVETARLFALGDSFALGFATAQDDTWTEVLARTLGRPVYNLGVSATGPGVQRQLLEHLLRLPGEPLRVEHLLWMIYEGNDLENSYATRRPPAPAAAGGVARLATGTLLAEPRHLLKTLKQQSIIARLLSGELTWRRDLGGAGHDPYVIDGVRLATPLYHSPRWGYRLFNPDDIERAGKDRSYLLDHAHRPLLDRTFEEMRQLANEFGFRVSVVIAPTAARVYGADFEHFPALSDEPHLIRYVEELAARSGFEVLDLLAALAPYADEELLYYRDDHHWNVTGNRVVADLIAERLFGVGGTTDGQETD